ncbi:unnamed protein product [Tenebrio molitor]|nr:unnamed protein product [Tenebrio molitor]
MFTKSKLGGFISDDFVNFTSRLLLWLHYLTVFFNLKKSPDCICIIIYFFVS